MQARLPGAMLLPAHTGMGRVGDWGVVSLVQSNGRAKEAKTFSGQCPTFMTAKPVCGHANPMLAVAPSAATKWVFEPVGINTTRFYIRQQVRHTTELDSQACPGEHAGTWRRSLCQQRGHVHAACLLLAAPSVPVCSPVLLPGAACNTWVWTMLRRTAMC